MGPCISSRKKLTSTCVNAPPVVEDAFSIMGQAAYWKRRSSLPLFQPDQQQHLLLLSRRMSKSDSALMKVGHCNEKKSQESFRSDQDMNSLLALSVKNVSVQKDLLESRGLLSMWILFIDRKLYYLYFLLLFHSTWVLNSKKYWNFDTTSPSHCCNFSIPMSASREASFPVIDERLGCSLLISLLLAKTSAPVIKPSVSMSSVFRPTSQLHK